MSTARQLAYLIGKVTQENFQVVPLLLALLHADAGAAFFETNMQEKRFIEEQRHHLAVNFRTRASKKFMALRATDQDAVLGLLPGKTANVLMHRPLSCLYGFNANR